MPKKQNMTNWQTHYYRFCHLRQRPPSTVGVMNWTENSSLWSIIASCIAKSFHKKYNQCYGLEQPFLTLDTYSLTDLQDMQKSWRQPYLGSSSCWIQSCGYFSVWLSSSCAATRSIFVVLPPGPPAPARRDFHSKLFPIPKRLEMFYFFLLKLAFV